MRQITRLSFVLVLMAGVLGTVASHPAVAAASPTPTTTPAVGPTIRFPVHMDISPALRSLEGAQDQSGNVQHRDRGPMQFRSSGQGRAVTSAASPSASSALAPTPGVSFDGIGVGLGAYSVCCAPPDPNGTVGPNHYVETVNVHYAVFSKSGTLLFGPIPINTVWSGFGGSCQTHNDGDPTVLYDPIADRWIINQFAVNVTPTLDCVAVSTTGDPTGTYFRYSFSYGSTFPDYPKLSVWPDAYYATFNMFNAAGTTFLGAQACAYDRTKMLTGAVATQQCFNTSSVYGGLLAASLDGSRLPPAGAPNNIVALDSPSTSSLLQSWKFHVDWTTPANSTFAGPTSIPVVAYTNSCAARPRGDCIPQGGGGTNLESLADRLMYRLAYRNFGDHEALVVNHTIEVGSGSSLHSGVRWYELRPDASRNLTVFQQGTYAPDGNWRWMGSAALDQSGSIALGYSVSSSSLFPQIHFTGRLATDPPGTMTVFSPHRMNGRRSTCRPSKWSSTQHGCRESASVG